MGFFGKLKSGLATENQPAQEPSLESNAQDQDDNQESQTSLKENGLTPTLASAKTLTAEGMAFAKASAKAKKEDVSDLMESEGELAVDVFQTSSDIIIQSAIAGVKPEDLDISVENDILTIRGERKKETEEKGKNYYYQECYWGAFSRQIILPEEVDPNRIDASMKNGILTIKLPKIERSKVRKISVKN